MITLSKNGTIKYENCYCPDSDEYVCKTVESLIPYLNKEVKLSDDFTLKDLFTILEKEPDNYNLIFKSDLGSFPLSLYIDDINKEVAKRDTSDIDYLEVQWICECNHWRKNEHSILPESKDIEIHTDFHGWGTWDEKGSPFPEGTKGGIAIEFTPLSQLKDIPLKIKKETSIALCDGTYEENGEPKILFKGQKIFSVHDFVSAILDEISFVGEPENRDKEWEKMVESRNEVLDKLASGDTSCLIELDELDDLDNINNLD